MVLTYSHIHIVGTRMYETIFNLYIGMLVEKFRFFHMQDMGVRVGCSMGVARIFSGGGNILKMAIKAFLGKLRKLIYFCIFFKKI